MKRNLLREDAVKPKGTIDSKQVTTPAEQFLEQYGVTPRFFVGCCLLPGLLAVTRISCLYRGVLAETLEIPAWRTRLRALRIVFAMTDAKEIKEKRIKIPLGALGPTQLTTIVDASLETDWSWITPEFLVGNCLKALDAMNTTYLFYQGRPADSYETPDWDTKLEALQIVGRVQKFFPNDFDNLHFATYRDIAYLVSAARQKGKEVQIVRETQLVDMR